MNTPSSRLWTHHRFQLVYIFVWTISSIYDEVVLKKEIKKLNTTPQRPSYKEKKYPTKEEDDTRISSEIRRQMSIISHILPHPNK